MSQILKTSKGRPITQFYLELGQNPARFEIQKMQLLYLKYILDENEESLIKTVLELQFQKPEKRDWASTCLSDLKELNITDNLEEIKNMSKNQFKSEVKEKISQSEDVKHPYPLKIP